jgi:hypothetical protein
MIISMMISLPTVHLRKNLYDGIVKRGEDVTEFVNRVVEAVLKEKIEEEKR